MRRLHYFPSATATSPIIIRPERWQQQPQGPAEIDRSSPFAKGLVLDAAPGIGPGVGAVEMARGARRDPLGANASLRSTPWGIGYRFSGPYSAGQIIFPDWTGLVGATEMTVECLYAGENKFNVYGGAGFHGGFWLRQWGETEWKVTMQAPCLDNGFGWCGAWGDTYSNTEIPFGSRLHAIFTWRGGASLVNAGTLFVNGKKNSWGAWVDGTPSWPAPPFGTSERFELGSDPAYGGETSGTLIVARIWRRGMCDAEMRALYENPWQLYKPQRRILYSLPAAQPSVQAATFLPRRWRQQPQAPVEIAPALGLRPEFVCLAPYTRELLGGATFSRAVLPNAAGIGYNYVYGVGGGNENIAAPRSVTGFKTMLVVTNTRSQIGWSCPIDDRTGGGQRAILLSASAGNNVGYCWDGTEYSWDSGIPWGTGPNVTVVSIWADKVVIAHSGKTAVRTGLSNAARTPTSWNLGVDSYDPNGRTFDGTIQLAAVFNGSITEAQARELSLNPWQLFQPRRDVLHFGAGAAPPFIPPEPYYWVRGVAFGRMW